jgi:hypothetical protein
MTANAFSEDRGACIAAGMDHYLAKPVKLADLRTTIERWSQQRLSWRRVFCGKSCASTAAGSNPRGSEFSTESLRRATKAVAAGHFKEQIVPIEIKTRTGTIVFDADEHVRSDASVGGLLGHLIGLTGAIPTVKTFAELQRPNGRYELATIVHRRRPGIAPRSSSGCSAAWLRPPSVVRRFVRLAARVRCRRSGAALALPPARTKRPRDHPDGRGCQQNARDSTQSNVLAVFLLSRLTFLTPGMP